MTENFRKLQRSVLQWAEDRDITLYSSPLAQAYKTLEEAGELIEAAALIKGMYCYVDRTLNNQADFVVAYKLAADFEKQYKDAVGDIMVTLIIGCHINNVDPLDCLESAYNTIKNRKGHMNSKGIFVKDEE